MDTGRPWKRRHRERSPEPAPFVVPVPVVEAAISAILSDLAVTEIGRDGEVAEAVRSMADNIATIEVYADAPPDRFAVALAEDVQQWLHDTFQHTSWPTCPRHGNHPLWLLREREEPPAWRCATSGEVFGGLGNISAH
jgi:hypothetical protein